MADETARLDLILTGISSSADELTDDHEEGDGCGLGGRSCTGHDAHRMVAALRKALAYHQPCQLYGPAESAVGEPICGHDPDYDGDRHFEGDDGLWYCKDDPTITVCSTCVSLDTQGSVIWPCEEYEAILKVLAGEAEDA